MGFNVRYNEGGRVVEVKWIHLEKVVVKLLENDLWLEFGKLEVCLANGQAQELLGKVEVALGVEKRQSPTTGAAKATPQETCRDCTAHKDCAMLSCTSLPEQCGRCVLSKTCASECAEFSRTDKPEALPVEADDEKPAEECRSCETEQRCRECGLLNGGPSHAACKGMGGYKLTKPENSPVKPFVRADCPGCIDYIGCCSHRIVCTGYKLTKPENPPDESAEAMARETDGICDHQFRNPEATYCMKCGYYVCPPRSAEATARETEGLSGTRNFKGKLLVPCRNCPHLRADYKEGEPPCRFHGECPTIDRALADGHKTVTEDQLDHRENQEERSSSDDGK